MIVFWQNKKRKEKKRWGCSEQLIDIQTKNKWGRFRINIQKQYQIESSRSRHLDDGAKAYPIPLLNGHSLCKDVATIELLWVECPSECGIWRVRLMIQTPLMLVPLENTRTLIIVILMHYSSWHYGRHITTTSKHWEIVPTLDAIP